MKDLSEDWWDNPTRKEINYGKLWWIWNEGLQIGRNLVVTGVVVSAMPLVVPPLIAISTLGVVVSLPFGVMYASYAVTDKVMNTLLPLPEPEPPPDLLWVNETVFSGCGVSGKIDKGHEVVGSEETGKEMGYQEDYDLDEEEKEMEDDLNRGTETRFELDIEEDEHGEILEEVTGFPIGGGYQPGILGEDIREIESDTCGKYEEDTSEKVAEEERKTPSSVIGEILRGIREGEISSMVAGTGRQIPEDSISEVGVSAENEEVGGTAIATEEGYEGDLISEDLVSEEDEKVGGKDIATEEGYEEDIISEALLSSKDEEVGGKDIATEEGCEEDSISEVLASAEDEEVGGEDIAIEEGCEEEVDFEEVGGDVAAMEEGCEEDEDFDEEGKEMEDDIRRLLEVKIESDEEKSEDTGIIEEENVFHIDDAHHLGIIGEGGRDSKDGHRQTIVEEEEEEEEEEVFPLAGGDHQLGDMGEEGRDTGGEEDEHRESTGEEVVFFTGGDHRLGNIGEEGRDTREMQKSDLVGKGGSEEDASASPADAEGERQAPSNVVREIREGIREAEDKISSMEEGTDRQFHEDSNSAVVVSADLGGEDDSDVEQVWEMAVVESENVVVGESTLPEAEVKFGDVEPEELERETTTRMLETIRDDGKAENVRIYGDVKQKELERETTVETIRDDGRAVDEKHIEVVSPDRYELESGDISNLEQGKPSWGGTGSESTLGDWGEPRRPIEELLTSDEKEENLEVDTEEKLQQDAKNSKASIICVKVKPVGAGEDRGFNAVEASEPALEIGRAITVAEEPGKLKRRVVVRVKRSGDQYKAADIHQESGSTRRSITMVGSGTDEGGGGGGAAPEIGYRHPYSGDDDDDLQRKNLYPETEALSSHPILSVFEIVFDLIRNNKDYYLVLLGADVNVDYSKLASLPGAGATASSVTAVPVEVMHDEEKIWQQIYAMRTIIGYEELPKASCMEELKALYEFTGVEPFESTRVGSDHNTHSVDVNEQLRFLMTIIGVE